MHIAFSLQGQIASNFITNVLPNEKGRLKSDYANSMIINISNVRDNEHLKCYYYVRSGTKNSSLQLEDKEILPLELETTSYQNTVYHFTSSRHQLWGLEDH